MHNEPLAYFITFRTFGTWHPGDRRGFNRHSPDETGRSSFSENNALNNHARQASAGQPVHFNSSERTIVAHAVRGVCDHRGWRLIEINVRSNHVHCIVVASGVTPEKVMNDLKSWSTRRLRDDGYHVESPKVWARHGSTRYLFTDGEVEYARWYTREAQDGARYEPDQRRADA